MSGTPRMLFYRSSLNPDHSRMGSLEIRVTYKVSNAAVGGQTMVVGEDYTARPILFFPMRDLASVSDASLFFSTAVAGYLGRDPESIAPVTLPMVSNAVRVYLSGGRSCGVQIYAEFEVLLEGPGFLDGGSLVLDAPSPYSPVYEEEAELGYEDGILPSFVGSSSAEFQAAGFVDGEVLVIDALPHQERVDPVERPPNFVGGFVDGGALVIDPLPAAEEDASVDGTNANDANRGMTAAEISQLKKVTQTCGGGTCSICLDDFSPGDLITLMPPCSHSFHAKCIAIWLRRKRTCPMCRRICTSH